MISNSGVVIAESEINVPLADGSRVSIDLVRYPRISLTTDRSSYDSDNGNLDPSKSHITLITKSTLLLPSPQSQETTRNPRTPQSQVLPPSTYTYSRKLQVRPIILLRPLLAFSTHKHLLNLAEIYFTSLLEPFQQARLPCSLEISRFTNFESLATTSPTPATVIETLLTTTQSTLTLFLPSDSSLSLQIQTPYQNSSQQTYQWLPPFTLKTSSLSSSNGEISFDALSDAESPIMLAVEESLSAVTAALLGPGWRKIEMREFEKDGKRIRVELRGSDHVGKIIVLNGSEEISCVNSSLQDILSSIS